GIAAKEALEKTRKETVGMLRDALENIETAHHHLELSREKLVPQARQALEANQAGYETGKVRLLDWIIAQQNVRDIDAMAQSHLAEYQAALAELEAMVGTDLHVFPRTEKETRK